MEMRMMSVVGVLALAGCDAPWDFSAPYPDAITDTTADTGADGGDTPVGTPCDGAPPEACCMLENPCGLDGNSQCDCDGMCPWDSFECGATLVPPPVDLIIVMDNSSSMSEEQAMLAAGPWNQLVHDLLVPDSHMPVVDIHIGVVSTDMGTMGIDVICCDNPELGDDGVLLLDPLECPEIPFNFAGYCSDTPAGPAEADDLGAQVACIAGLGIDGCCWEQHMRAAEAAIQKSQPGYPNDGFLRFASILAVLYVTDEDDCSVSPDHPEMFDVSDGTLGDMGLRCFNHPEFVTPVDQFISSLGALRDPDSMIVVGVLAGVPPDSPCIGAGDEISGCLEEAEMQEQVDMADPSRLVYSCESGPTAALPPRRLVTVAQAFGETSYVGSICEGDYTPFMQGFAEQIMTAVDNHAHY